MTAPARRAAFAALRTIESGRALLTDAIVSARDALKDDRDRTLLTTIVTGTERWRSRVDWVLARSVSRELARVDFDVLQILRLSAYQLLFLTRVPASAVVHDAVDLTRAAGKSSAAGFVNAVLRQVSRTRHQLDLPQPPRDVSGQEGRDAWLDALAVTGSHPRWLLKRWLDRMGPDATMAWVAFNNEEAPLTLRANTLRTSRDHLTNELERHGVGTEPLRFAPDGLRVVKGNPLRGPLSKQGLFIVQDESSQLVTLMAGTRARRRTLDACAAPGGKTLALAAGPARGQYIIAGDRRWRRLRLLRQYVQSAGASGVAIVGLDLERGAPFGDVFDLVLVDAPCTGLGTVRREVDIRWRRSEADITGAADVQSRLIQQAAALVAPGGRLVYATCSSEPEENQQVVDAWLANDGRFRRVDRTALKADGMPPAVLDDRGQLQTRPDLHGLEAFFAAAADRIDQR